MFKFNIYVLIIVCLLIATPVSARAPSTYTATGDILKIGNFIERALENDATFEELIVEGLKLNYDKDLKLPADDIVLDIKSEYELQNSEDGLDSSISLSKLFPYAGTQVSAEYSISDLPATDHQLSQFNLQVSQPVAKNAFGNATRLKGKLVDIQTDIAKYQVTEAYEDYLAVVITSYYNWYSAYENLNIARNSYQQSLKLLENIKERKKNSIALPVDVNKVELQVLAKNENLVMTEESYQNILDTVKRMVRADEDKEIRPAAPFGYEKREADFNRDYKKFKESSRTYRILKLLERNSKLKVESEADDLLPSANLMLGFETEGEDTGLSNPENSFRAGVSINWPFPSVKDLAEKRVAEIENRRQSLANENKYEQLRSDLKNLYLRIEREEKLIDISDKKIELAQTVLDEERKNYSYGKVTLNDYIQAVNTVDQNKFTRLEHVIKLSVLTIEWLRLTDRLVGKNISE